MLRSVLYVSLLPLLLVAPKAVVAQDSALGDQERFGERLFNQSCIVCHKAPQLGSAAYAPALSKDTLGGKADVMRDVISNGTPRMPGFKIQFTPAQIEAIVAYVKTLSAPPPAAPAAKPRGAGAAD